MSRAGRVAVCAMAVIRAAVSYFGSERIANIEARAEETESALSVAESRIQRLTRDVVGLGANLSDLRFDLEDFHADAVEAFSLFDDDLRELEDQMLNLQDRINDLETELFFLGFDVSASAPVLLEDFAQDGWSTECRVSLPDSAVLRRGSPLTVGDWVDVASGPLVDADCPAD